MHSGSICAPLSGLLSLDTGDLTFLELAGLVSTLSPANIIQIKMYQVFEINIAKNIYKLAENSIWRTKHGVLGHLRNCCIRWSSEVMTETWMSSMYRFTFL